MMKRLLIIAAIVAAALSCSEGIEELTAPQDQPNSDLVTVSLTAALSDDDATRVTASSTEGFEWSFKWEEGDQLWFGADTNYLLTTSGDNFDESNTTFTGEVPSSGSYYFLGGLNDFTAFTSPASIDLSTQDGTMADIPIISTEKIDLSTLASGEVGQIAMEHIGAFVKINIDFGDLSGYTLSSAYITGMSSYMSADMISYAGIDTSDDDMSYTYYSSKTITVTLPEPIEASGEHTIPVVIFPTTIEVGESISITLILDSTSGEDHKYIFCTKSPTTNSYEFARATVNTIGVSAGVDDVLDFEGEGIATSPYLISTAEDLNNLSTLINFGSLNDKCFKLTNNIDLEGSEDNQFTPIGSSDYEFEGTFDGAGYTISGLYINNSWQHYSALFGITRSATIMNLGVSGYVLGFWRSGGIVGDDIGSTIINCYNSVSVTGQYMIGGIVGDAYNTNIINCCNLGTITNTRSSSSSCNTGGIAGYISDGSNIINCYNGAAVKYNTNSYIGSVIGNINTTDEYPITIDAYNDSDVSVIATSYTISSGAAYVTASVTDYSTEYMQSAEFVAELNSGAYAYNEAAGADALQACAWVATTSYPTLDFDGTPSYTEVMFSGGSGTESDPYKITTTDDLYTLATKVNAGTNYSGEYFLMKNNIDLESVAFTPIGNSISYKFQGTFDGGGYDISGLNINGSTSYTGLFGCISGATIKNLGVDGVINGTGSTGGIAGYSTNASLIINCYNLASVTANNGSSSYTYTGGIVGESSGSIINCYNMGAISATSTYYLYIPAIDDETMPMPETTIYGTACCGGIAGSAGYSSLSYAITNCYNTGTVSASTVDGGSTSNGAITGYAYAPEKITYCNWASDLTGATYAVGSSTGGSNDASAGVMSMTSSLMKADTFVTTLNNGAYTYNEAVGTEATQACAWETTTSYPTLDFGVAPSDTSEEGDYN